MLTNSFDIRYEEIVTTSNDKIVTTSNDKIITVSSSKKYTAKKPLVFIKRRKPRSLKTQKEKPLCTYDITNENNKTENRLQEVKKKKRKFITSQEKNAFCYNSINKKNKKTDNYLHKGKRTSSRIAATEKKINYAEIESMYDPVSCDIDDECSSTISKAVDQVSCKAENSCTEKLVDSADSDYVPIDSELSEYSDVDEFSGIVSEASNLMLRETEGSCIEILQNPADGSNMQINSSNFKEMQSYCVDSDANINCFSNHHIKKLENCLSPDGSQVDLADVTEVQSYCVDTDANVNCFIKSHVMKAEDYLCKEVNNLNDMVILCSEGNILLKWLQNVGLLPAHNFCTQCMKPMLFNRYHLLWYCRFYVRKNKKVKLKFHSQTIRRGTIFSHRNMTFDKILYIAYFWYWKMKIPITIHETKYNHKVIDNLYSIFEKVIECQRESEKPPSFMDFLKDIAATYSPPTNYTPVQEN